MSKKKIEVPKTTIVLHSKDKKGNMYPHICENCECVFIYNISDAIFHPSTKWFDPYYQIVCPECNSLLLHITYTRK